MYFLPLTAVTQVQFTTHYKRVHLQAVVIVIDFCFFLRVLLYIFSRTAVTILSCVSFTKSLKAHLQASFSSDLKSAKIFFFIHTINQINYV